MYNPVLVVAILVQWLVSRANRTIGAITGFVITAGVLIWGLSAYSTGGSITFIGIRLSQPIFLVLCLVWFAFDVWDLQNARKAAAAKAALQGRLSTAIDPPDPGKDSNQV